DAMVHSPGAPRGGSSDRCGAHRAGGNLGPRRDRSAFNVTGASRSCIEHGFYLAGTMTNRSLPDSAPHTSPARPSICRTSAPRLSEAKLSNFSVTGSNLTIALVDQSVNQTLS